MSVSTITYTSPVAKNTRVLTNRYVAGSCQLMNIYFITGESRAAEPFANKGVVIIRGGL